MNAQYYIWADGVEQGPMSLPQLMREWKAGNLPKGFLWRREDQEAFQTPDGLGTEQPAQIPLTPPSQLAKDEPNPEDYIWSVRNASQYKHLRFWLGLVTISVGIAGTMASAALLFFLISQVHMIFGIVVGLVCWFTTLSIAAAVDQGLRLAIDAVDVMIDRGRKGC